MLYLNKQFKQNSMNLKEYLDQENPTRANKVILNDFEYKDFGTIVIGADYFTSIKIIEYPEYNYVLKNGGGYLHTTDEYGNPKAKSVFYIENLNKVKQNPIKDYKNLFI